MSRLTVNNRDMEAMEDMYLAEIHALRKRVKELETKLESHNFKFTQNIVIPKDWPNLGRAK